MATLTWVGGGGNKASNPQDWSPTGAPQSGDTLQVVPPGSYTMNVRGDALAGDALQVSTSVTLNLSHDAAVTADINPNLSTPPTVDLTANLGRGVSTFNLSEAEVSAPIDINLAKDSVWVGSFFIYADPQPMLTTAGKHALFINEGDSTVIDGGGGAVLAMPVAGSGTISVTNSSLVFKSSVAAGLSVSVNGNPGGDSVLTIDQPKHYHASTTIGDGAEIDLVGLANADSYSLQNDLLKLYSGDTVIYRMTLSDASSGPASLGIVQAADGVHLLALAPLSGPLAGELPLHSGA